MKNEIITNNIDELIYNINGRLVILDSDLASLYNMKTKRINETVSRNKNKFSTETWILSDDDFNHLRSLVCDRNIHNLDNNMSRVNPRVFTENGIKILASILRKNDVKVATPLILDAFKSKNESSLISSKNLIKQGNIQSMIFEVRGIQVILDSDLAKLYGCKNGTKEINQAYKNNPEKFSKNYSFILTDEELRSKVLTANYSNMSRSNPRVFTELGVIMMATILKTPHANKVSILIVEAFVMLRRYLSNSVIKQEYINDLVLKDNKRIDLIEEKISKYQEKNNHLFYEGQIYDAYSLMLDIFDMAKKSIVIVDNYLDKHLLDILSKTNKTITVITNKYNNILLKITNKMHDRFIYIDNYLLYHSGASFKDLGKKCFAITKLEDEDLIDLFRKKIDNL